MNEVEIIGGGIAGLSLAIGLRNANVPVRVREAGMYPRHRLCGEFVNGVTPETLSNLGLEGIFEDAKHHRAMKWWLRNDLIAKAELDRPVQALSRWELDDRMKNRFEDLGGIMNCKERVAREPRDGRVWAAGRFLKKESQWLGLKAHFPGLKMDSGLEMHLGNGGYVGLTPVEEDRVNVCGLFEVRKDVKGKGSERFLAYLTACGLSDLVDRLRTVAADEKSVTGVSGIGFGQQTREESELLSLGDAERLIPPFTGNGMSMAFEAAESALEPLADYSRGKLSWDDARTKVQHLLHRRFNRRIKLATGLHGLILKSPGRDLIAAASKSGLLPFALVNRIFT